MLYKTEDQGLFIGMTTTDYQNLFNFIENEVEKPFEQYRENLKKSCNSGKGNLNPEIEAYFEYLYKPKVYGVFGSFNLMTIALVDDFAFASRYFHPFNSYLNRDAHSSTSYAGTNYTFNVISGVCPRLEKDGVSQPSLLEKAKHTFLQQEKNHLPFVANVSLKINNALLIGTGGLLIDLMLRKIAEILDEPSNSENQIVSIIHHSLSWNELSILFFSNSFDLILTKIFEIRELSFNSLITNQDDQEINGLYTYVRDSTLLKSMLDRDTNTSTLHLDDKYCNIDNAHLFVHTNSVFGYDIQMLKDIDFYNSILGQQIDLLLRWEIKPGHFKSFQIDLAQKSHSFKGKLFAERSEYAFQIGEIDSISKYIEIVNATINEKTQKHIRRVTALPIFPDTILEQTGHYFDIDSQYLFHNQLHAFRFTIEEIDHIREILKNLRLPMILQDKISKMFVIYNNGIHDPILYGYFIELRMYLQTVYDILRTIEQEVDNSVPVVEIVDNVYPWVEAFELAYKNRFGQSYVMNEIMDFNIEFNGGIQQLISAYDGAYKSLTALFKEDKNRSIVYVAGQTNVESDYLSVRLNYLHLYQPEFFAAVATHEAANYLFERKGDTILDILDEWSKLYGIMEKIAEIPDAEMDASIINYFSSDLLTLYLGFNRDLELFFFWHWACFIQTGLMYKRDGTINQDFFDAFISRMQMIGLFIGDRDGNEFYNDNDVSSIFKSILPPYTLFNPIIQAAWERGILNTKQKIINLYINHRNFFREVIRGYAQNLMLSEFGIYPNGDYKYFQKYWNFIEANDVKAATEIEKAYYKSIFKDFTIPDTDDTARIKGHLLYALHYYKNKLAEKIKINFDKDEVFTLKPENNNKVLEQFACKPSFNYHSLFLAYLTQITQITDFKWALVFRDAKTLETKHNPLDSEMLKLDSFGGLFASNIFIRQKLFKARSLFLKSLWDFSTQEKRKLFEDI